ncbi:hypothetical protein B0H13DRAFT_2237828 [Mycena leptocephala]|nr:hypothetical protein B0H13DRAFT_2237828 [Mycena leptocephala]
MPSLRRCQAPKSAPASSICARGGEMMHRFSNWAVQRWLEAATGSEERRKSVACAITELSWTSPAPQIFAYGNKSLNSKSLVMQHAFENLEESAKDRIVDELLGQVGTIFGEHNSHSEKHRQMALEHLLPGLLEKEMIYRVVQRMCEPARCLSFLPLLLETDPSLSARRAMIADKNQRAALYDCIRVHIVTLCGCKTCSKVIWLFDRMRAYYGY